MTNVLCKNKNMDKGGAMLITTYKETSERIFTTIQAEHKTKKQNGFFFWKKEWKGKRSEKVFKDRECTQVKPTCFCLCAIDNLLKVSLPVQSSPRYFLW